MIADIVGYYVDHNFDDRCYTKPEIDARFAAKPVAGYGQRQGVNLYPPASIEVVSLTNGSGALTTTTPARFSITGAVTIGNQGSNGDFSVMYCQLQINSGGGYSNVGLPQGTESIGNSNHDEAFTVALTATVDEPAGTYNIPHGLPGHVQRRRHHDQADLAGRINQRHRPALNHLAGPARAVQNCALTGGSGRSGR